ncbi:MAG: hypothetical protein K0S28_987 [Paucimonas sp.]|nr:hypothetical protein [Paucimonas sp.]
MKLYCIIAYSINRGNNNIPFPDLQDFLTMTMSANLCGRGMDSQKLEWQSEGCTVRVGNFQGSGLLMERNSCGNVLVFHGIFKIVAGSELRRDGLH